MSSPKSSPAPTSEGTAHPGLRYARIAGYLASAVLLFWGMRSLIGGGGAFELFRGAYFVVYGLVLSLPFGRLPDRVWRGGYGLLVALSAGFVFVIIVTVMFAYMAAAELGEKLGVPGFEGTLIFLTLLQVPVVLFQRKPDLLD